MLLDGLAVGHGMNGYEPVKAGNGGFPVPVAVRAVQRTRRNRTGAEVLEMILSRGRRPS